jgi:transposase InsO family protein
VSQGRQLHFLVDSGADISLVKSEKLLSTAEFEPKDRVRVKSIEGSMIETHGSLETQILEGEVSIPYCLQLVSKQIDLKGDGILGRDFLKAMRARICYRDRVLTFQYKGFLMRKNLTFLPGVEPGIPRSERVNKLTLPARAEVIVQVPVDAGPRVKEGVVEKAEMLPGVYMAESLVKVENGCIITSIINTTAEEVELSDPVVKLEETDDRNTSEVVCFGVTEQKKEGGDQSLSRGERVIAKLKDDHLNGEERKFLREICFEYQDVFYLSGDKLSCTNAAKHTIQLEPGVTPINTRPYRLPESQKEEIDRQVKQLVEDGIIAPSESPWNSPLLIVPKKAGPDGKPKWRMVVDFRKLNEKTVGDAHPLPDITEILDQLGQSKYFTCLDMAMGYHQIELEAGEGPKTAFSTKQGHWEYLRLPFGLKTAPATFQKMMNSVLSGLTGTRCFVYLDDIVLYARSLAEHDVKLREVLDRLRTYKLKLQPEKCQFLRKEVNYLGHQITEAGVRPDPQKVAAIERFPTPTNPKQLKAFCGMISYYRRFIPNCSRIASPLYKLLKQEAKFEWTETQENAFQHLKSKLIKQPILQYPDFSKEFVLTTDASNQGLGAVLSQGPIGKDLPIAYASRSLNSAESHYTTSEKELLAVVWATKYFRPYLYGRTFKIVSDHKPLVWIMNVKDPGSRLMRWRIQLAEYTYEIVHKSGIQNTNADALSRIGRVGALEEQKEILDDKVKRRILYEFHDSPVGGHRGMNKTYRAISSQYTWPKMRREVEDYVKQCKSCQVNKILTPKNKAPMQITTTAERPFEKCYLDVVGPLPVTLQGNKYILTFQDDLSRYVVAIPLEKQDAETIARAFVEKIVLLYGTPQILQTDQGANFMSEMFRNTCNLLKIKKIQSTAFHPESQGGIERSHRVLAEYLRHYVSEDQTDWDLWIPFATYVYNTTRHSATSYTPFELLFGRPSTLPFALKRPPEPSYNYDDYVSELKGRLQTAHQQAHGKLIESKAKSKEHYDKTAGRVKLKVGDKVLLFDETVRRGRSRKLSAQWLGPYTITEMDKVNATITRGRKSVKVHTNRLKLFH